jgi:hypothetical protein
MSRHEEDVMGMMIIRHKDQGLTDLVLGPTVDTPVIRKQKPSRLSMKAGAVLF